MAGKSRMNSACVALKAVSKKLWISFKDLLPIILVIAFFQAVVLRQPLPELLNVVGGGVLVVFGLLEISIYHRLSRISGELLIIWSPLSNGML